MNTCEVCRHDVGERHVVTPAANVLHQSCYRACTRQSSTGVTHVIDWLSVPASVMIWIDEEDFAFFLTSFEEVYNIFRALSTGTDWVVWLHRAGTILHAVSGDVTAVLCHDTNVSCERCKRFHDEREVVNQFSTGLGNVVLE